MQDTSTSNKTTNYNLMLINYFYSGHGHRETEKNECTDADRPFIKDSRPSKIIDSPCFTHIDFGGEYENDNSSFQKSSPSAIGELSTNFRRMGFSLSLDRLVETETPMLVPRLDSSFVPIKAHHKKIACKPHPLLRRRMRDDPFHFYFCEEGSKHQKSSERCWLDLA